MKEVKREIMISQPDTGEEEWQALREPLQSGWLTAGPKVAEFERRFAERHQVKHAIAVTNATSALHLALAAYEIGPGDEVIVPAFTWVATANVAVFQGAKPVFADIEPETFNIDPDDLKQRLTPRTRAIIPVHLFGLCADMDRVRNVADGIPIIEDAACASGAGYKGWPAGSLGDIGCFSFHPRKSITTGEGGMVTTSDDRIATRVRSMRNHGASISEEERHRGPQPYILADFDVLGYNYRMTDLQAAVGIVQLAKLDKYIDERAQWAEYYRRELAGIKWLKMPSAKADYRHGWQSFVTFVDKDRAPMKRNDLMRHLKERGIATRPGTHAVHMLGYYRDWFGLEPGDYPAAQAANDRSMAIPLHNRMSDDDYRYVVQTLIEIA